MKKIIAFILLAALALSFTACGSVSGVAVLWADSETALSPNSLINAMDRAMYIESIDYTYYGAQGDAAKQLQQAQEALNAGCTVLMVELVDSTAAAQFVELAKAKATPILFFGTDVEDAVADSYEKCYIVKTDAETLSTTYTDLVCEYVLKNAEVKKAKDDDMDLDDDGKISYVTVGDIALTETTAIEKDDKGEPKLNKDGSYKKAVELVKLETAFADLQLEENVQSAGGLFGGETTYRYLTTTDGKRVEMVLVADDAQAKDALVTLLDMGMNADQLATCFVPLFTTGNTVDYKALVLDGAPEDEEGRKAHLEANKFLCDLTVVEQDDLAEMIFTTINVIDSGRISGTAMENYDGIAEAAAKACAAIAKGNAAESVTKVAFTTYAG